MDLDQYVRSTRQHFYLPALACQQADCAPAELMHVGDSLASDVAGANAAGAASVWLNRESLPNRSEIPPDHEVQSLAEVVDIVKQSGEG